MDARQSLQQGSKKKHSYAILEVIHGKNLDFRY
jgi:hypothetical protein